MVRCYYSVDLVVGESLLLVKRKHLNDFETFKTGGDGISTIN